MLREIAVNREDHFARNAANRALRQYLDSRQENHRTTLLAAIDYFESEPNDSETFSSEELQQAKTKMEDVETLEAVARQIDDEGSDSSEETALWQNLWNDPVVQRILNQYDMEKKKFVTSILADLDKISTAVDRLEEKYFRSEAGLWKAYAFSKGEELSEDMWQEFDPQYLRASEIDAEIGDVSFIAMTIYAARLLQKMNRRDENNEPTNNIETMTRIWRAKAIFAPFLESSGRSGFSQALLELGDKLTQRFSGNTDQAFQVAEAQELLDSLGGPDQIHQMSYMYMKDIFAGDVVHEPSFAFNDDLNVIVGEGIIAPDENPENDMRYIFRRKTPLSLFKKIKRKNAALDEKIAQAESQEDRQHLESERITIQNAKKKILDLLALTVIPKDREAPGESKRSIAEDAERRLATILANAAERISHSDIFEIVAIETFGQDEKWHSLIQTALENVGFNMELFQPDRDRDWINAKIIFRDPARDVIVELQFATEEQRESNNLNHDSSKAGRKDTPEDLAAKRRWRETRKGLRKSNGLPQDSLGRGARFKERLSSIIGDPFSIALSSLRKTS